MRDLGSPQCVPNILPKYGRFRARGRRLPHSRGINFIGWTYPWSSTLGLPGEGVSWKAFDDSWVVECPLDIFVYKTDGDNDGSCGPHNLRETMACRTMVGGWWGDGRESAVRGELVQGW